MNIELLIFFIVFYLVIGTLLHAKIILELLLQNDKAKAFSEGGDPPLKLLLLRGRPPQPPITLINNEGEELIRKGKNIFKLGWLTLLRRNLNLI